MQGPTRPAQVEEAFTPLARNGWAGEIDAAIRQRLESDRGGPDPLGAALLDSGLEAIPNLQFDLDVLPAFEPGEAIGWPAFADQAGEDRR
jgi:hypothetical protein